VIHHPIELVLLVELASVKGVIPEEQSAHIHRVVPVFEVHGHRVVLLTGEVEGKQVVMVYDFLDVLFHVPLQLPQQLFGGSGLYQTQTVFLLDVGPAALVLVALIVFFHLGGAEFVEEG